MAQTAIESFTLYDLVYRYLFLGESHQCRRGMVYIGGTYVLTSEVRCGQSWPMLLVFCWFESSKLTCNQLQPTSLYCALWRTRE